MQNPSSSSIRWLSASLAAALMLASGVAGATTPKLDGAQYLKDAKVTLAKARSIALHTVHGSIVAQELEKERGGSGLRYSFDIKSAGSVHEVGVDARTGKVLENSIEGDHPD